MPSFNHSARSVATSILSHSSSLASCVDTYFTYFTLAYTWITLNSVCCFFTCSHMKGPLWLNDWKLSDPCWMFISVSIKMEVRKRRQRCREPRCKIWVCSLQNEDKCKGWWQIHEQSSWFIMHFLPHPVVVASLSWFLWDPLSGKVKWLHSVLQALFAKSNCSVW